MAMPGIRNPCAAQSNQVETSRCCAASSSETSPQQPGTLPCSLQGPPCNPGSATKERSRAGLMGCLWQHERPDRGEQGQHLVVPGAPACAPCWPTRLRSLLEVPLVAPAECPQPSPQFAAATAAAHRHTPSDRGGGSDASGAGCCCGCCCASHFCGCGCCCGLGCILGGRGC